MTPTKEMVSERMNFETNATSSSEVLGEFQEYLYEKYGLYYPDSKLYSLKMKIKRRVQKLPVESIVEYGNYLQDHESEIHKFLDEVSTNKTAFFREDVHFDHMINKLIPAWEDRSPIKIWSSACSTGPEPYSASMVLDDQMTTAYKILATDISNGALTTAKEAIYPEKEYEKIRSYDPEYIRYLDPVDDHKCKVIDPITQPVSLRKFNLKHYPYPPEDESIDLIFCRNVMLYFDDPMIEDMAQEFYHCLRPGGFLYIGRTETLGKIEHDFRKVAPSIFQKPTG